MKTLHLAFLLIAAFPFQLYAGELFREVTVNSDSWEVVFHEKGERYRIEIDDVDRGTSGYLQRLRLLGDESLRLIDKHWYIDINPVDRDGRMGIEITRTFHDRVTGEKKVETTFEPEHKAESKDQKQCSAN